MKTTQNYRRLSASRVLLTLALTLPLAFVLQSCGDSGDAAVVGTVNPYSYPNSLAKVEVIDLGTLGVPGSVTTAKLRQPSASVAHVGSINMHPSSGYVDQPVCSQFAEYGYAVICINSVFTGREGEYYGYEQHAPAIAAAVKYLREKPGITKVLLLGRSMGAPLMAFYQNAAENGPDSCGKNTKLMIPCNTDLLKGLPAADGMILIDSHLGEALSSYSYVDPAVINNDMKAPRIMEVDMFAPSNGYVYGAKGTGSAKYTEQFKAKFLAAQAARNVELNTKALAMLADARRTNPKSLGDELPFYVAGSQAARLFRPDISLLRCTKKPQMLLSRDGTRPADKPVCSVRTGSGDSDAGLDPDVKNQMISSYVYNVHTWLGSQAMNTLGNYTQTESNFAGFDPESSVTSAENNIKGVTKPFLLIANSGHYFVVPDEILFDAATMKDKTFAIQEGSVHGGAACVPCAKALGKPDDYFGDTFRRTLEFTVQWIDKRY